MQHGANNTSAMLDGLRGAAVTVVSQRVPSPPFRGLRALIKEARQRQRRRHVLLAFVLIVVASAAGTGHAISKAASSNSSITACATSQCASAASPATGVPNPCTLLTDVAAATALGTKGIQDRNSQLPPSMGTSHYRMCVWTGTPLSNLIPSDSTVTVMTYRSTRSQFIASERASRHDTAIHGLGEAAYAWTGAATILWVLQHGSTIQIQVSSAVNPLQAETKLGKLALTRLP